MLLVTLMGNTGHCQEGNITFAHSLYAHEVAEGKYSGRGTIKICAARGEKESFLVIVANKGKVPELTFPDTMVFPPVPAVTFTSYLVSKTICRIPKDPKLARKRKFNPRRTELAARAFPDKLVMPKGTERADGRVIFWVTLEVPEDAEPGEYYMFVDVKKDEKTFTANFTLKVWNFKMPSKTSFRMAAGIPRGTKISGNESALRRCENNFAAHHVSCRSVRDPKVTFKDGKAVVDWSEFDTRMRWLIDTQGMNWFQFPFAYVVGGHGKRYVQTFGKFGRGNISEEFKDNYAAAVKEAAAHLKEKGWLDKFFVNFSDEPYENQYEETRTLAKLISDAAPELKPACFGPFPNRELAGSVKHWITHIYHLDPRWKDGLGRSLGKEKIEGIRKLLGEEIKKGSLWSVYNPLEDYTLASAPAEQRTLYWWCFKEKVHSMMQWTVHDGRREPKLNHEWNSIWVYVDSDNNIVNTIRWETTREGIEDYEYLRLLEKKKGREEADKICSELVRSITDRTLEPRKIIEARRKIGEMLDEKKKEKEKKP